MLKITFGYIGLNKIHQHSFHLFLFFLKNLPSTTTCLLTISTFRRPKTPSSIFKASIVAPPLLLDLLPSLYEDACDYLGPTRVFQAHHPISEALITPAMFLSPGEITYSQVLGIRTWISPGRYYSETTMGLGQEHPATLCILEPSEWWPPPLLQSCSNSNPTFLPRIGRNVDM